MSMNVFFYLQDYIIDVGRKYLCRLMSSTKACSCVRVEERSNVLCICLVSMGLTS